MIYFLQQQTEIHTLKELNLSKIFQILSFPQENVDIVDDKHFRMRSNTA